MLEEVARHATSSQHNPRSFRRLLNKLKALSAAERAACWGGLWFFVSPPFSLTVVYCRATRFSTVMGQEHGKNQSDSQHGLRIPDTRTPSRSPSKTFEPARRMHQRDYFKTVRPPRFTSRCSVVRSDLLYCQRATNLAGIDQISF